MQTSLSKVRLYAVRAQPCNNNRGLLNCSGDASLRLIEKMGSSLQIRQASLLALATRLEIHPT